MSTAAIFIQHAKNLEFLLYQILFWLLNTLKTDHIYLNIWADSVDPNQMEKDAISDQDLFGLALIQLFVDTSTSKMDSFNF